MNKGSQISFILILVAAQMVFAQEPFVPSEMKFADLRLKINEGARKEIQEDVDALTASPRYFQPKVERARLYFPIIEKILAEENVPEDVKYLVMQESALIPDAVSSSKAVGYWQFKDFTAIEMGLRVDKHIDERMNIVSSTRAAARYFKKNNFYFDNWLIALQAYQMGAGAALKEVSKRDHGAKSMVITKKTYWYIKKFLAHKIAFEHALNDPSDPGVQLVEYTRGASKSLRNVANEVLVDEEELKEYNKWLKNGRIPADKTYSVIVPVKSGARTPFVVASARDEFQPKKDQDRPVRDEYKGLEDPDRFPEIKQSKHLFSSKPLFTQINGIPGVIGKQSQTVQDLADLAGISELKFRSYNEIMPHESIQEGQVYYFKKKKAKAKVHYHTVQYNESLWIIAQKYGVRMSKLIKKNRLSSETEIKPGLLLWLRYVRPANAPVVYRDVSEPAVPKIISENSVPEVDQEEILSGNMQNEGEPDSYSTIPNDKKTSLDQEEAIPPNPKLQILHEVEAKETLYSISRMYGIGVMDIVNWNELNLADGIRIGQILELWVDEDWEEKVSVRDREGDSMGEDQDPSFVTYRVQPGDTMFAIAKKYGVTVEDVKIWNDKKDSSVSIGEKLRIKQ